MESLMISLFAETFIHPGSGQNEGGDQSVARERTTGYPFVAGSSMKGAWLDYAKQNGLEAECNKMFGSHESAGQLLINDARLLLLPVRSLNRSYCWITCPFVLERLERDLNRCHGTTVLNLPTLTVATEQFMGLRESDEKIFLEERYLQRSAILIPDVLLNILKELIPYAKSRARLSDQLVIVSNREFKWFAENGLTVQARNSLNSETKESENLWYEESLPPDTLMISMISQRDGGNTSLADFKAKIIENSYLQVGGNETIGQGWFRLGICPPLPTLLDAEEHNG